LKLQYRLALDQFNDGRFDKAEKILKGLVEAEPENFDYCHALGLVLFQLGDRAAGVRQVKKAVSLEPHDAQALQNLGSLLAQEGKLEDAVDFFERARTIAPDHTETLINLGTALTELGRLAEAHSCFESAAEASPNNAKAHYELGNALVKRGMRRKASTSYRRALELRPNFAEAHFRLGSALRDQGKIAEGIAAYKRALKHKPDYGPAMVALLHQLQHACQWDDAAKLDQRVTLATEAAIDRDLTPVESPFLNVIRCPDPERNWIVARLRAREIEKKIRGTLSAPTFRHRKRVAHSIIKVGYLSNDYFDHATAHLMLGLFALHDRSRFRIYGYSYGEDDGSRYRARISEACDEFIDIAELSYREAADRVYQDRVDILVDLKGYTLGNRLEICAYRPAPVQATYLGFPGTTGANYFDYIIADKIVAPKEEARWFSEKLVHLPDCYQVNDDGQKISSTPAKREDFGLSSEAFVFCSFVTPYKIEPVMFDAWMAILRELPGSVLWLYRGNALVENNLKREAMARGVKADRLVFADKMDKAEHLARLALADLGLDTRIYNGHTTTSDALWAGVPVIAMTGSHFASRVSTSILTAIGLPDLVTDSLESYQALAIRLARQRAELRALRAKLEQNRATKPLFDTARFTRNIECAFVRMWELFLKDDEPSFIEVTEN
jgi:protein O-GlcNAc transferase